MAPSDAPDRGSGQGALRLRGLLAEQRRLQAALRLRMGDLRADEAERDRLALLGAELRGETQRLGSRLEEAQREHEAARELLEREHEAARERLEREHEAARERLERLLSAVQADVARAAASRAWRLGHGTALLLARVTLRRPDTESALDRALSRLEAARRDRPH